MFEFLTSNSCGTGAWDAAFPVNPFANAPPDVCALIFWVSVVGGVLALFTILTGLRALNQILSGESGTGAARTLAVFAALWAIGAPLFAGGIAM